MGGCREQRNSYNIIDVHWSQVLNCDEKWRTETIANTSEEQFRREFECEFLGSANTLLPLPKLRQWYSTILFRQMLDWICMKNQEEGHTYVIRTDVSRGTNNDYSAFIVLM